MSTPHKHAEAIKAWSDGAKIEVRGQHRGSKWCVVEQPLWWVDQEYRVYDPLREFKEAYAAGKTLQLKITESDGSGASGWYDVCPGLPASRWEQFRPDGTMVGSGRRYALRVKSEPKTEQFRVGALFQVEYGKQWDGISARPAPFVMPKVALDITYDPDTGKINDIKLKDWKQ